MVVNLYFFDDVCRVIKVCVGFVSCFKKTQSTKVIEARIQEEHMAAHEYTNDVS